MAEQLKSLAEALTSRPLLGFVTLERAAPPDASEPAATAVAATAKVGGVEEGTTKPGIVRSGGDTE